MTENQDDVIKRITDALPEIGNFIKEACEAVFASAGGAPTDEQKREICEAIYAGEQVLEALQILPDLSDEDAKAAIKQMVDQWFAGQVS